MQRLTNDGVTAGQTGRFRTGLPDTVFLPDGATTTPGQPPFIFMTGGGGRGNESPDAIGMMPHFVHLTDTAGYSICQPDVPWLLGNPESWVRIDEAIAWGRANLGWSNDPPILMGSSNGWACAATYMRHYDILCAVGILAVADGRTGLVEDLLGLRDKAEDAGYSNTDPPYPPWPEIYGSPYHDAMLNGDGYGPYPFDRIRRRVQAWITSADLLYPGAQHGYATMIEADIRTCGGYGHVGTLGGDFISADNLPTEHIDPQDISDFIDGWVATV